MPAWHFLAADEKAFSLCSPHGLDIKTSCNANINERHDVDPEFCEDRRTDYGIC